MYFGIPFAFTNEDVRSGVVVEVSVEGIVVPVGHDNSLGEHSVSFLAQVQRPSDVEAANSQGADGIGETRSELAFDDAGSLAGCEPIIAKVISAGLRPWLPLPVRFFDFSEDKPRPSFLDDVDFSALGYRGVRVLEKWPEAAAVFANSLGSLKSEVTVVAPMVTTSEELTSFIGSLPEFQSFGVTIETPAAVLAAEDLLTQVGFCEIGLNDLTQYTLAWNRNRPHARLPFEQLPRALLAEIEVVATVGSRLGTPVTLAFDLPPSPKVAEQLLEAGLRSVTVPPRTLHPWRRAFAAAGATLNRSP